MITITSVPADTQIDEKKNISFTNIIKGTKDQRQ